jgi:hypothetical protein
VKQGDEAIYSIIVPGLTNAVEIEAARRALVMNGCSISLVHIGADSVSVPRLYTRWRGDSSEQTWQAQVKAMLPGALIDVRPWSYAPGYPQGEVGEATL